MSYEKLLTGDITYWAPGAPDGYGTKAFDPPIHLKARYQFSNQELVDQLGQKFVSVAIVYLSQQVEFGGFISNGVINLAAPSAVPTAYRISKLTTSINPTKNITVYRVDLG